MSNEDDVVKSPNHYTWRGGGIEPKEVAMRWGLDFAEGNALKYLYRWPKKGRLLDLEKAIEYLEMLRDREIAKHKERMNTQPAVEYSEVTCTRVDPFENPETD